MLKTLAPIIIGVALIATGIYAYNARANNSITYRQDDKITLYSIDGGKESAKPAAAPNQETFHGFNVLGKFELKDRERQRTFIGEINKAIAQGNSMANCFWPRHGIRIEKAGGVVDYVICFYCKQLKIVTASGEKVIATSDSAKSTFNQLLTEAGIELAPE